jgi:glycosyltransferase involved in cell wall biosynthesis
MHNEIPSCPEISIVIPTYNRKDELKRVLEGLNNQTCDDNLFEIIVVDDGSEDDTQTVVKEFSRISKPLIKYIHQTKSGAGAARNAGIAQARGRWILFIDADLIPEKNVIECHLNFHRGANDDFNCLLGAVETAPELKNPQQVRQNDGMIRTNKQGLHELSSWEFRTCNTSLAKHLCASPGGFDSRLEVAEDTEFAYRLQAIGVRFLYDESIKSYHYHPMNMEMLIEKYAAYGRAVALWYLECLESRRELALRYGVFAAELPFVHKVKYIIRAILVNGQTVALWNWISRHVRKQLLPLSQFLNKSVAQFYCRKAFRSRLFHLTQIQNRAQLPSNLMRQAVTSE